MQSKIVPLGLKDGATLQEFAAALKAEGLKPYQQRTPMGSVIGPFDPDWSINFKSFSAGIRLSTLAAVVDENGEVTAWHYEGK